MFEEYRASDELSRTWQELAERVHEALDFAGIPNHMMDDVVRPPGAEIEIDHGNDEMGGVFVQWRPSPSLVDAVRAAVRERRTDAAEMQSFTAVATAMRDGIIGVLRAAAFEVVPIDDYHMRPAAIHVLVRIAEEELD